MGVVKTVRCQKLIKKRDLTTNNWAMDLPALDKVIQSGVDLLGCVLLHLDRNKWIQSYKTLLNRGKQKVLYVK